MSQLLGVVFTLFLFLTILIFNLIQVLSLIIKPFSRSVFRRVNRWAANTWWGLCDLGAKKVHGVQIIITGDELPMRENSIVILNHQMMTDIPVIFSIAKSKERLGDLKWFVKDILKYIPGVGWGMLFLDCLFIKRDWMADQKRIHQTFEKILKHSIPLWLMTFAEGTRLTPAKLIRSQNYAREHGLTPPRHVQVPRTKGFVASVQSLREHIDAVYDLTIGYVNGVPTLWEWVKGDVRSVHLHARRFPVGDLPSEDTGLANWLLKLFREKDALLDYFYQSGSFGNV